MSLLDLLCPPRCASCGEPGASACRRCRAPLEERARPHRPTPSPAGLPPLWVVASYDGSVRQLLLGFKERGLAGLADTLAVALADAVRESVSGREGPVALVPVPSSAAAVRQRGDDVVALLARRAARALRRGRTPAQVVPALGHARLVADSAGLSATQRALNLRGAFVVRPWAATVLRPLTVVVVDDLVTTGATLCEASRALAAGQVHVTAAAAVAATRRRG